jgi:hypothetical protein
LARRHRHSRKTSAPAPAIVRERAPAARGAGWLVVWGLALLVVRLFVPAESAHLGETLWIVQLWLCTATVWLLFALLRRDMRLTFDRADAAAWLLVGGQALTALVVLATDGHKRAALNLLWEWVGVGVAVTLLRQWLARPGGERLWLRTLVLAAVVLAGLGLWQYTVEFPRYRGELLEFEALAARANDASGVISAADASRLRELQQILGPLTTAADPLTHYKLRQRLMESTEPLGRFALANTLGGLLAAGVLLVLGAATGIGRDARGNWRAASYWLAGIGTAYCLLLTKSRTAWAGLLAGAAAWCLLRRGARLPLRRIAPAVGVTTGIVVILTALAAWSGGLDRLVVTEAPKSLHYRLEYWRSSLAVVWERPLLGVGPGNFRQHYLAHKLPASSEEILDPHNQFLDVWASGGLAALAGLLWIWWQFLGRCRRLWRNPVERDGGPLPSDDAPAPPEKTSGDSVRVGIAALLLFFGVQYLFEAVRDDQAALLLCGWVIAAVALGTGHAPSAAVLAAGLAWGVHLLGAGGIAMPAVSVPLFLLVLGVRASPGGPPVGRPWPAAIQTLVVLIALGATAACALTATWPSSYARLLVSAGDSSVLDRGDFLSARHDFEEAARVDSLDPDPRQRLAELEYRSPQGGPRGSEPVFRQALAHLDEAIRRDPHSPKLYWTAGQWRLERFQANGDPILLEDAIEALERAKAGYPSHAGIRATLAEALSAAGRPEATDEARTALDYDDLNHQLGHIDRWLDPGLRERLEKIAGR